jgi:hypothetical protein
MLGHGIGNYGLQESMISMTTLQGFDRQLNVNQPEVFQQTRRGKRIDMMYLAAIGGVLHHTT